MVCEQEALVYKQSLREYTAAKAALQQIDSRIDAVGKEAMSGLISTWKCILTSKGNPLKLAQCVVGMPTEREVTDKLRQLAKEARTAQDRLAVSETRLKAASKALADCRKEPPPPPPAPVPPVKRGKVPPALKLRAWSGTITYVHTDSFEGDCLVGFDTPAKVTLATREEHTWTITGPPQDDTDLKLGLHPVEWRVVASGNVTCDTRKEPGWGYLKTCVGTGTGHKPRSLYFLRPPEALTTVVLSSGGPPGQLPNAWHVDTTVDNWIMVDHYSEDQYLIEWFKEFEIGMPSTAAPRIQGTKTQPGEPHQLMFFGMQNPSLIDATNTWSWDLTWTPAKVTSNP